ncbi:MAG TPA: HAMP domain-containing protein, partial [Chroococcales cyanobacterium]
LTERNAVVRSIQSIIFIRLFIIILIFFGVVSAVAYFLTRETMRQFVVSDASTSLSFIINNVKTNYQSDLTALDQIANMDGFLPFDEARARPLLKDFLEFPNIFSTVHMYQADGKLLFAERRATMGAYYLKPNFHLKEPEFVELAERVIREKRPAASNVFYSKKGTLFQTYVTPVFSDEAKQHVFGILSGGVFPRLQKIDHLLKGLKLSQENFILITDNNAHFICSDGIAEADAGKYTSRHTLRAAKQFFAEPAQAVEHTLISEKIKLGKSSFIVLSQPIPELKLIVTLGVNTHRIDEKTRELSYRLLVALAAGMVLTLFASIFIGDRLAKPFRRVVRAVDQINSGNFSARVDYGGDDEIGYLSKSINRLAEKIQKSEFLGNLWSTEDELRAQKLTAAGTPDSLELIGSPDDSDDRAMSLEFGDEFDLDLDVEPDEALDGEISQGLDAGLDYDLEAGPRKST